MTDINKALVRRLVDHVMNANDLDVLDEICSPALAPKLRIAFTQFRTAFPDWHQELIELVAEHATVVARFRCTGTQHGEWEGLEGSGRTMRIDEVYFFRVTRRRLSRVRRGAERRYPSVPRRQLPQRSARRQGPARPRSGEIHGQLARRRRLSCLGRGPWWRQRRWSKCWVG